MNNLHISLTEFTHESRALKQTATISSLSEIEHIFIAALHTEDLNKEEKITDRISLKRFALKTRNLSKSLPVQILKYLEFVLRVFFFYKEKNINIVNIHSLALLPLGYLLRLIYRAKLIYDTHELETEQHNLKNLRKKMSKWLEYLLIKKVDHIFVVSENIADWYEKTYNIARPTVLFNAPRVAYVNKTNYFKDTFHLRDDQIILLYQGGLLPGRGCDILLEAFKKNTNDKIVIVFMGYGEFEKEIQFASKLYKNIFFHESVPPDLILKYTASADVGIALIENRCLSYNFCMPNKLFEYAMAGLPVIVSNVKEMSAFVKKYQIGVVVEDYSVTSLNEAIERLLRMDLAALKQSAKKAALDNSWEHQEEKMRIIYKKLILSV
jgi:glycosyltransferase involved in cell wall biosynthesis